jgi:hypothetical protein
MSNAEPLHVTRAQLEGFIHDRPDESRPLVEAAMAFFTWPQTADLYEAVRFLLAPDLYH